MKIQISLSSAKEIFSTIQARIDIEDDFAISKVMVYPDKISFFLKTTHGTLRTVMFHLVNGRIKAELWTHVAASPSNKDGIGELLVGDTISSVSEADAFIHKAKGVSVTAD